MRIKMLKTTRGSNDGKVTMEFQRGKTYDVSDDLGNSFLEMEVCEEVSVGEGEDTYSAEHDLDGKIVKRGDMLKKPGALIDGHSEITVAEHEQRKAVIADADAKRLQDEQDKKAGKKSADPENKSLGKADYDNKHKTKK